MAPMTVSACCCCHSGCDFENITLCCVHKGECLCCTGDGCLASGEQMLGPGMITNKENGECCKLGLGCCSCGLKTPSVLCDSWGRCLCFYGAESFPMGADKAVDAMICAVYCLQCAPTCGCCQAPGKAVPTSLAAKPAGSPVKEMEMAR